MDDGVILSEAEFDNLSKQNVERWVSAHVIPVSIQSYILSLGVWHAVRRWHPQHQ